MTNQRRRTFFLLVMDAPRAWTVGPLCAPWEWRLKGPRARAFNRSRRHTVPDKFLSGQGVV
jgi:hypothetical protein